jgi:hypothetical protein
VSPREHVLRTEAIVLRRRNWGEADRILTLFSAQRGKFRAKAVGIRKPRSRKAGHLELFMRSMLLVARGRELDIVTQAETLEAYRPLRDDLLRSAAASYVAEMIDRFSPDESGSPAAFALLDQTLQALCSAPVPQLVRHFDRRWRPGSPQLHNWSSAAKPSSAGPVLQSRSGRRGVPALRSAHRAVLGALTLGAQVDAPPAARAA